MLSTKKITTTAILVALATVLHIVESLLPNPLPIPGVKLGLSNIITLLGLIVFDFKTGLLIAFLRTVLGSLLGGTFLTAGFFLSFSGAMVSTCVMGLALYLCPGFSLIGVSVAGAAAHNLGQLAIAGLIIEHTGIFFYLPVLLISAIPTGIITGMLLKLLLKHLNNSRIVSDRF